MTAFARLPDGDRTVVIAEAAARLGISPLIVEKDFWVCWMLGRIFAAPSVAPHVVFKGGTSLSKVFGAIRRFSEDVDLSVAPAWLGWEESDLDDAPSNAQRRKRFVRLEKACADRVQDEIRRTLERGVRDVLGPRPQAKDWLTYEFDEASRSPVLLFAYPQALPPEGGYIAPAVRMEFGSLTDQRPVGTHPIRPLLADVIETPFDDSEVDVVALEIERTFWEKATILHAEHHRPADQPIRDRLARHYADLAALWQHPAGQLALSRIDLLEKVAIYKARFFGSSWANYHTARRPTLKLSPPDHRRAALAQDYAKMAIMFAGPQPRFADVLSALHEAEAAINAE